MAPNSCSSMSKSPRSSPVSQPVVSSSTALPRERDGIAPSGGNGNGQIQESEPAWLLRLRSVMVSVSSGGRAGHFPDLRTLQRLAFLKVPVFLKIDETQQTHSTPLHSACKRILVFFPCTIFLQVRKCGVPAQCQFLSARTMFQSEERAVLRNCRQGRSRLCCVLHFLTTEIGALHGWACFSKNN